MSLLRRCLADWCPGHRTRCEILTAGPVAALSAVLDQQATAADCEPLRPLWHWLHFLDWPPQAALDVDGHPATRHFLPTIPDRRRMFAGGHLCIEQPLIVGERTECVSSLANAVVKHGRSGELAFVTAPSSPAAWQLTPDIPPTMLFCFSALTVNAHRIHYDAPYARDIEGYSGLVVHGSLLALLMLLGDRILVHGGPDGALAVATALDDSHAPAEVRHR